MDSVDSPLAVLPNCRIVGQDVELTLYRRRGYRIVFRTQFLNFRCAFELCRLY